MYYIYMYYIYVSYIYICIVYIYICIIYVYINRINALYSDGMSQTQGNYPISDSTSRRIFKIFQNASHAVNQTLLFLTMNPHR